jgi:hypothetical protein
MLTAKVAKSLQGGGGMEVNIPVLVAAAPPYPHAVTIDSDVQNTTPRDVGMMSPMDIFTHALSTREHSITTPRLTVGKHSMVLPPATTLMTLFLY